MNTKIKCKSRNGKMARGKIKTNSDRRMSTELFLSHPFFVDYFSALPPFDNSVWWVLTLFWLINSHFLFFWILLFSFLYPSFLTLLPLLSFPPIFSEYLSSHHYQMNDEHLLNHPISLLVNLCDIPNCYFRSYQSPLF